MVANAKTFEVCPLGNAGSASGVIPKSLGRGRKKVVETAERAASNYREGEPIHFETVVKVVTPNLAFVVENERSRVKIGGREALSTVALRVTAIFRPEEGIWKILHRHADTVVSKRSAGSPIEE